jgi:hypothetical protein
VLHWVVGCVDSVCASAMNCGVSERVKQPSTASAGFFAITLSR